MTVFEVLKLHRLTVAYAWEEATCSCGRWSDNDRANFTEHIADEIRPYLAGGAS